MTPAIEAVTAAHQGCIPLQPAQTETIPAKQPLINFAMLQTPPALIMMNFQAKRTTNPPIYKKMQDYIPDFAF